MTNHAVTVVGIKTMDGRLRHWKILSHTAELTLVLKRTIPFTVGIADNSTKIAGVTMDAAANIMAMMTNKRLDVSRFLQSTNIPIRNIDA